MRKHYPLNSAGAEDAGQLPWSDGVPSTGTQGSYPGHAIVTDAEAEILAAIDAAGLVRSGSDLTQLPQAMARGLYLGGYTGSANALAASLPNGLILPALLPGMRLRGIASSTNTGSATVTIAGFAASLGTLSLLRRDGTALQAGDIQIGVPFDIQFDGSAFRMSAPTNSEITGAVPPASLWHYGPDTGAVNALVVDVTPSITSYVAFTVVQTRVSVTNTGASTINADAIGVKPITRADGSATQAGDLIAGEIVTLIYDGTAFQIAGLLTANLPSSGILIFTTSTSYAIPSGVTKIKRARIWGGGGGGGGSTGGPGAGSGAGGGGYAEATNLTVGQGQTLSVVVGTAGQGGVNANGANGGTSSLGLSGQTAFMAATGGGGGIYGNNGVQSGAAGDGGVGSGPGLNASGGKGSFALSYGSVPASGIGGAGAFGGGNPTPNLGNGSTAGNFPGGGSNGGCGGSNGGNGGAGLVIIEI